MTNEFMIQQIRYVMVKLLLFLGEHNPEFILDLLNITEVAHIHKVRLVVLYV